ncbi:MAG: hypothetical protein ACYC06_04205 [Ilumatobacteraceae bacterium]
MHIIAALFIDTFEMRPAPGPSTHIDLTGVFFSIAAPSPVPVTIEPHLIGLIYCPSDETGSGVFEVVFRRGLDTDSEQLARHVSPFTVEPGKFTYRLVRGSLLLSEYGQCFAHCRIGHGPWTSVPLTLLPPVVGEQLQSPQ